MSPTSSRGSNQVRKARRRTAWPVGLALILAFASLPDAKAQFLGSRRPDVVVNLHALDRLESRQPAPRAKPRPAVAHSTVSPAKRSSPSRPASTAPRSTRVADVTIQPELKSHLLQLPSLPPAGSVYPPAPPAPSVAARPAETGRPQASQAAPTRPRATARPSPAPRSQTAEAPRAARPSQPEPPPPPPVLSEAPPAPPPAPVAEAPRPAAPPPPAVPSRQAAAPNAAPPAAPPPAANPAPEPPPPPPALAERAPAPPPPPAPPARPAAPAAAAPGPQVATAPATGAPRADNRLRLLFDGSSSDLSDSAKQQLQQLAGELTKQSGTRIQLLAYAEGTPTTLSQARRLSLDRALTVRSYLANQGVNTTRIDVRALGNQTEKGAPANRVDLLVMQE